MPSQVTFIIILILVLLLVLVVRGVSLGSFTSSINYLLLVTCQSITMLDLR